MKTEDFRGLVMSLSRGKRIGHLTQEDLEQELWTKLVELLPRFETIDQDDVFRFAKAAFKNHINDLLRYVKNRDCKTSYFSDLAPTEADHPFEELVSESLISLTCFLPDGFMSQLDHVSYRELTEAIMAWAGESDSFKHKFARELVAPSETTLSRWRDIVDARPTKSVADSTITVPVWAEILGVPKQRMTRNLNSLRSYLKKHYLMETSVYA